MVLFLEKKGMVPTNFGQLTETAAITAPPVPEFREWLWLQRLRKGWRFAACLSGP
jgi:hypothetical protein